MWNPGQLSTHDVEDYLGKSHEAVLTGGVGSLPLGAHVRDDEQVSDSEFARAFIFHITMLLGSASSFTMWL